MSIINEFGPTTAEKRAELERVVAALARSDSAAAAILEGFEMRDNEIASLQVALGDATSLLRDIAEKMQVPPEPANTLRQRLIDPIDGLADRLTALEAQQIGIISRQQQELWQRRAELHAALRPRSRWVHFLRIFFPPNPGPIDHLTKKGL